MQISLKQVEIVAALKAYVASQGFNLVGKQVDITFTAGRKEGGLTADVSIEDGPSLPDLGHDDEVGSIGAGTAAVIKNASTAKLTVVGTEAKVETPASTPAAETPAVEVAAVPETKADEAAPTEKKVVAGAGTSLFA